MHSKGGDKDEITRTMLNWMKTNYLQVKLNTDDIYITSVECGGDGTIFISDEGLMYGCGGNKANKLGLDGPAGWLLSGDYPGRVEQDDDDDDDDKDDDDGFETQPGEVEPPRES